MTLPRGQELWFAGLVACRLGSDRPVAKRRWNQAYKLARYGLTQALSDRLLKIQQYACAMCHTRFEDEQPVLIDHDHPCCPMRSPRAASVFAGCYACRANTTLGLIEHRYDLARAHLERPPGLLVAMAAGASRRSGRLA
jgi:hypothetical protein